MRHAVLAPLLLAACSFEPSAVVAVPDSTRLDPDGEPRDGAVDAAPPTEDAGGADGVTSAADGPPPDGPPTWVVVQTLTVPASGAPVTSPMPLAAGVVYRLRASGTFQIGGPGLNADAEYWDLADPKDGTDTEDQGLAVDDPVVDLARTPDWGPYRADHVYEVMWTGEGTAITANIHDGFYGNNAGSLTLEILELR